MSDNPEHLRGSTIQLLNFRKNVYGIISPSHLIIKNTALVCTKRIFPSKTYYYEC
jgi:hypothetical protein